MKSNLYHVSFPYLGINVNINPIAFAIGPMRVRWYGIILATGFLTAFIYVYFRADRFKVNREDLTNVIILGTMCGILGARLYYVVFYPDNFYKLNPQKIFNIYEGGMAIYGGIIAGLLGGIIVSKLKRVKILSALDLCSLGLLLGQAIGRWGNFFNQEAFGNETKLPWGMSSEATKNITVHPCFLYESLWCILGFAILHILSNGKRLQEGTYFISYILWYGIGRAFIESFRTDSLMIINAKVSQLFSLILVFVSICIIIFKHIKVKNLRMTINKFKNIIKHKKG